MFILYVSSSFALTGARYILVEATHIFEPQVSMSTIFSYMVNINMSFIFNIFNITFPKKILKTTKTNKTFFQLYFMMKTKNVENVECIKNILCKKR